MEAMAEERINRGGRPPTGRKTVLQAAFEGDEAEEIAKRADREGKTVSAIIRELTMASLRKGKRK